MYFDDILTKQYTHTVFAILYHPQHCPVTHFFPPTRTLTTLLQPAYLELLSTALPTKQNHIRTNLSSRPNTSSYPPFFFLSSDYIRPRHTEQGHTMYRYTCLTQQTPALTSFLATDRPPVHDLTCALTCALTSLGWSFDAFFSANSVGGYVVERGGRACEIIGNFTSVVYLFVMHTVTSEVTWCWMVHRYFF
jgi:hypothetical protein